MKRRSFLKCLPFVAPATITAAKVAVTAKALATPIIHKSPWRRVIGARINPAWVTAPFEMDYLWAQPGKQPAAFPFRGRVPSPIRYATKEDIEQNRPTPQFIPVYEDDTPQLL